ncbi:MAG TPA: glutamine amidotransferase [Planctomycetota bacterium]|nr:glutamine amidotransferase [Planctomycetota bacterium]
MRLLYWLLGLNDTSSIHSASEGVWQPAMPLSTVVLVALVVAGIVAAALNFMPGNVMPLRTRATFALIRLCGFALLIVMLCQLELSLKLERVLPSEVAVVTDVSSSMGLTDVGGKSRLEAARQFNASVLNPLSKNVNLVPYAFNASVDSGKETQEPGGMTRLFDAVGAVAGRERDLQAIVLLTDGNDTQGDAGKLTSAMLAARGLPVYPVVFGEAGQPRLASVKMSSTAAYVRLGDELRLSATLSAREMGEQIVTVRLLEAGKDQPITVRENVRLGTDPVELNFTVKPDRPGERTYRVVLDGVGNSVSTQTLAAEHTVQVLNSKIRVLYLDIPRDERKILGHWLARDPVIELSTLTMMPKGGWYAQGPLRHKNSGDGLPNQEADLYQYEVIILGDIPRSYFRAGGDIAETKMQWLAEFVSRRGGALITLGGRSVYAAGQYQDSALSRILPFEIPATEKPEIPKKFRVNPSLIGLSHPAMQLEPNAQANREAWFDLPPLDGCNRVGKLKAGATLLASRDVPDEGAVPVIAIQNVGKGQVLALSVDTTWRWEMMRPAEGEDYFRRFWGNAIRSIAPDPRLEPGKPQIIRHQSETAVGQTITLSTRLVDSVFQPVRNAEVVVKVTSPSGKVSHIYPADGRSSPGLYEYDLALTEAGEWQVATTYKGQTTVEKIQAGSSAQELEDPRARPEVMASFARETGGRAFSPEDAAKNLLQTMRLSPRKIQQSVTVAVWNLPATMAAFILLVCLDCWLRKRRGMV